jgi:hypothetical protein
MRIALPTCSNLPDWEVDDAPLFEALAARGAQTERPVWDDLRIDWATFDAVLVRTVWDYQDKLPAFLDWIDRVGDETELFNPAPVLRWNTDKRYLRELAARGVRIAPTEWLEAGSQADVAALVARRGWESAFLKPVVGATARETLRFRCEPRGVELAQAHVDRLLPREGLILQPYLASVETVGELSLILVDGDLSHAVRKIPVPGDYRVQDDFGASDRPEAVSEETVALARAALRAATPSDLQPLLYGRVDFMTGDDGSLLLGELELIEPSLFLRHDPAAAGRIAEALLRRLEER